MTDPDRYDLDLLEPLGAVAPPTPEVLNRVADNLHAHYLQDATSSGRPATFTRHGPGWPFPSRPRQPRRRPSSPSASPGQLTAVIATDQQCPRRCPQPPPPCATPS